MRFEPYIIDVYASYRRQIEEMYADWLQECVKVDLDGASVSLPQCVDDLISGSLTANANSAGTGHLVLLLNAIRFGRWSSWRSSKLAPELTHPARSFALFLRIDAEFSIRFTKTRCITSWWAHRVLLPQLAAWAPTSTRSIARSCSPAITTACLSYALTRNQSFVSTKPTFEATIRLSTTS